MAKAEKLANYGKMIPLKGYLLTLTLSLDRHCRGSVTTGST